MIIIHSITGMVTAGLSIWFLTQKCSEYHPVGILCWVALFILAYEQLRVVGKRIFEMCEKEWTDKIKLSEEEDEKIIDFDIDDEDDILI